MKKRILSLLLVMSLFLAMFSTGTALAQDTASSQANLFLPVISDWAVDDLAVGDKYGIYPQKWYYETDMTKPITPAQLRVLMAGIRIKLNKTDCVTNVTDVKYLLKKNMTVKDVLETFYTFLKSYEFNKNIGIVEGEKAIDFMAKTGIFTGKEGELSLKDVCTIEQACVIATRLVTYIYDVLDAASKGFLWEIKSGENTVYLLGSIHLANFDIYPFSKKILNAFADSDVLCVEADILNPKGDILSLLLQYAYYTDGTTLKDHVTEDIYQKAVQAGAAIGLTEEMVALMKPWYIYLAFSSLDTAASLTEDEYLTSTSLGIDMSFLTDAYLTGKPIIELEGLEFQIKMLNGFSDELQELLLESTLDSLLEPNKTSAEDDTEFIKLMLKYWHDGDVESFLDTIAPSLMISELPEMDEEDKNAIELFNEYKSKFINERDKGMAEKIDQFLKAEGSTTYFVVVGSLHYISDYSIIDILKDKGYEVNQIK